MEQEGKGMTTVYLLKIYSDFNCNYSSVLSVHSDKTKAYDELEEILSHVKNNHDKLLFDVTEMEVIE